MYKRFLIPIVIVLLHAAVCAAQDQLEPGPAVDLIPVSNPQCEVINRASVEFLNESETGQNDIVAISTNEDGTLRQVSFSDGTNASYTYEHGEDGRLDSVDIQTNTGVGLHFSKGEDGKVEVTASLDNNDDKNSPAVTVPITSRGKIDLESVATNPVKFDINAIKTELETFAQETGAAAAVYNEASEPYYEKMAEELENKESLLKEEGVDLSGKAEEAVSEQDAQSPRARSDIDEAVMYVKREAEKIEAGAPRSAIDDLLATERSYRVRYLDRNRKIYEASVEKAMEYVQAIIDKLVQSKIAVYMNADNDKIEAVIKLPSDKE